MKRPGPLPTSCLTCHQRKKKCDRGQPACTRCTVGGFRCLGYEPTTSGSGSSNLSPSSSQTESNPVPHSASYGPKRTSQLEHTTETLEDQYRHRSTLLDESRALRVGTQEGRDDIADEPSSAPSSCLTWNPNNSSFSQIPSYPQVDTRNCYATDAQPRSTEASLSASSTSLEASGLRSSDLASPRSRELDVVPLNSSRQRYQPLNGGTASYLVLPPRFYPNPMTSGSTVKFILSLHEPLFNLLSFKPLQIHCKFMRDRLIARIQLSSLTHWSLYLGAKVFRTLLQGGQEVDLRAYDPWLERLTRLCITSRNDKILEDMSGRLSSALELAHLYFLFSNPTAGYTLLRDIAPTFMHVVFADPTLWPRLPTSGMSLVHLFTSHNFELARFVFMDTLSSMSFGIPPLIGYDTSAPVSEIDLGFTQRIESIHGCAAIFTMSIAKVNIWRARGRDMPVKHSWEEIEADIWSWRPQPDDGPIDESWKTVARLATQEGWRHAVLIYLYMGMCDVTSHDLRVQSSVQQIMNLLDAIRFDDPIGAHFFFPCLLAGICVRGEKRRARIRDSIVKSKKSTAWTFREMDMMLVLEHLWHGRAANGGAVTWEDYVGSRRARIWIDE